MHNSVATSKARIPRLSTLAIPGIDQGPVLGPNTTVQGRMRQAVTSPLAT